MEYVREGGGKGIMYVVIKIPNTLTCIQPNVTGYRNQLISAGGELRTLKKEERVFVLCPLGACPPPSSPRGKEN